jgi:L-ascorbate metabolism protein UlaG (beta-lactamase superfamily)
MVITYHGAEFFKVQFGDTVIAYNPISKDSKQKTTRFGADIVLVSTNHPDFNGVDNTSHGDREPFVISGPGEYEVKGIFIKGFLSKTNFGGESKINTIYTVAMEGMNLCFLGALGNSDISKETMEDIDEIDILFTPIGGDGVLEPAAAYKLAVSLEPKLIIPMQYNGDAAVLKKFLKEGGEESKPVEKLTLKKKDLEGKEGEIIVLESVL